MFEEKYRQANDSIHPREGLLEEMQRKRRPAPYLRWSTVAACAVVVLALGLFFGGRLLSGAKSMQFEAAAADTAGTETAPMAGNDMAEYKSESTMVAAEGADENGEVAEAVEPEENGETEYDGGAPAETEAPAKTEEFGEIAAISDGMECRFEAEGSLLRVYMGSVGLYMELPEAAGFRCAGIEIEGEVIFLYFEDRETMLVLVSEEKLYRFVEERGVLEICGGQGLLGTLELAEKAGVPCTDMELEGSSLHLSFERGDGVTADVSDPAAPKLLD